MIERASNSITWICVKVFWIGTSDMQCLLIYKCFWFYTFCRWNEVIGTSWISGSGRHLSLLLRRRDGNWRCLGVGWVQIFYRLLLRRQRHAPLGWLITSLTPACISKQAEVVHLSPAFHVLWVAAMLEAYRPKLHPTQDVKGWTLHYLIIGAWCPIAPCHRSVPTSIMVIIWAALLKVSPLWYIKKNLYILMGGSRGDVGRTYMYVCPLALYHKNTVQLPLART